MLIKFLRKISMIILAGLFYYAWIQFGGPAIPCIFRMITGWLCPGCGITTLFICLLHGDYIEAYTANPFLFCTGPGLILVIAFKMTTNSNQWDRYFHYFFSIYAVALIIFGVLRNF